MVSDVVVIVDTLVARLDLFIQLFHALGIFARERATGCGETIEFAFASPTPWAGVFLCARVLQCLLVIDTMGR